MKHYSKQEVELFRRRAHKRIPSGAHTYSRADDQFSANAPAFIESGKGAICFDTLGESFIDYGMGLFSVSLGHANDEVVAAIQHQLERGNSFTRPHVLEGELAEELCDLIPCAEMVKFAKNGSDTTSAAVRLARAYTGKDYIITIKEHPFHSFDDWFIGSTSRPGGVPQDVREQTLKVPYNDLVALEKTIERFEGKIACLLMEPVTFVPPGESYLQHVRELCNKYGIVLVFDEIITGFRWDIKGAQHYFGVTPDLATFGKGMANGFACAAIVGKREIMNLGRSDGDVFLLSCTYGGELVGLTAAKKTIEIFKRENVVQHIWEYGRGLITGLQEQIEEEDLASHMKVSGYPCRPVLSFYDSSGTFSFELKTLFIQEMVKQGIFMERICISFSHDQFLLDSTLEATQKVFSVLRQASEGRVTDYIEGDVVKPVFT